MFKTKMQVLPVPTVFLQVVGKACELTHLKGRQAGTKLSVQDMRAKLRFEYYYIYAIQISVHI